MQTGLIDLGNNCYMYFLKEGGVLTGAQKIDGKLYLFSESGMPYIGWQTIDGKTYYVEPETNVVLTGFQEIEGSK